MRVELEDWKNGWYGIGMALKSDDIDELISLLQMIKDNPDQHFHISSEYAGDGGVGDIEFYVQSDGKADNMIFFGKPLEPGTEIPDPKP